MVDTVINLHQSRAVRYVLSISTAPSANTTPVLRDVRRAIKIFSYTVAGHMWGTNSPQGFPYPSSPLRAMTISGSSSSVATR